MECRLLRIGRRASIAAALILTLATGPANSAPAALKSAPAKTKATPAKKPSDPKKAAAQKKGAAAKKKTAPKPIEALAPIAVTDPPPPAEAARLIAWVAAAQDNGALPYIVIDKQAAALWMFGAKGDFLGSVPVLIGIGVGDDSTPGVGAKDLDEIGPAERTTPAGRFVAKFGRAFGHQRVLWVDYANSVALHAVLTTHKAEKRLERLDSPSPDDNRITFGCINVATDFYTKKVRPLFQKKGGIVYILPDTKSVDDVFPRVRLLPYIAAGSAKPAEVTP